MGRVIMGVYDTTLRRIASYCKNNIWEYEERLKHALHKMDYFGQTLEDADRELFHDINNALYDYSIDYDVDVDNIAVEDVIFI